MDKVKTALAWLKQNPLTTACLVIVLLALISLYYPTYVSGKSLRDDMAARQRDAGTVNSLLNSQVQIRAAEPGRPPVTERITITDSAIKKLEDVNKGTEEEYRSVFQMAEEFNRRGHDVLLPGLFPIPTAFSRPFDARTEYQNKFSQLYTRLDAGTPPSDTEVQAVIDREEAQARQRLLLPPDALLNDGQRRELQRSQANAIYELFRETAAKHHIYAASVALNRDTWRPGPFAVMNWAQPNRGEPQMENVWEGQMQVWMQEDVVEAIRRINRVDDPDTSLVDQPIKRLMPIIVEPKYIGEPSTGRIQGGALPSEAQVRDIVTAMRNAESNRLPDNFEATPTGRVCNPLYDVRHLTIKMVVDSARLPEIIAGFSTVNFMTVIGTSIEDVDEYAHLKQGFFYGYDVDAVEATLLVETIWLRSWTAGHLTEQVAADRQETFNEGLMPDAVRYKLGLPVRDPNFTPVAANRAPTINR